jgi:hypothetical protein
MSDVWPGLHQPEDAIPVRTNTGTAPTGSRAASREDTMALEAVSPKRDKGPKY